MEHVNLTTRVTGRGIMQWDDSEKVSFTNESTPWSLYNQESKYNVKAQEEDKQSILSFYGKLIALKKSELFTHGNYVLQVSKENLFIYVRSLDNKKGWVYCNFSEIEETIKLSEECSIAAIVLMNSGNKIEGEYLILSPCGTVVFTNEIDTIKND